MSTDKLYHYTYIITNIVKNKYYIGCRSSRVIPSKDLGIKYFSSSKDKEFVADQKANPQNYKYKIIATFDSKLLAINLEIKLHNIHNVGVNPSFYNRAKQTSVGWDTTGVKRPISEETKIKIRLANKGRTVPRATTEAAIAARAVLVDIYDKNTNQCLAKSVSISAYAREFGYNRSLLAKTLYANRSLPCNMYNRHNHKGIYARPAT